MPFACEAERPGRPGGGDDRDLVQRVLAIEIREHDALLRFLGQLLHLRLAELGVHQHVDDLRIPPEAAAVGVIGREEDPPRIVDQQEELEPDRPLHGVHEIPILVHVRHDPAAGLVLDVEIPPLASGELVEQVLPRTVGCNRHRVAEEHGARIGRQIPVRAERVRDARRLGAHAAPVVAAVRMELQMREVRSMALQHLHRLDRRLEVAGDAEVVAVQVDRMRQMEIVGDGREVRDDHRRRHPVVAFDRRVQRVRVLAPLPRLDAAGIHRFHAVCLRRPYEPRDDVFRALGFAGLEQIEDELVVGHEHERRLVDDRDVVQLLVRVTRGQDRHGRFVDGRPPHAGVQISGGKRGRRHAAEAGAAIEAVQELARRAMVLRHQPAREVEGAAGDVRVNVHAARHHDHAACVDRARARGEIAVGDDPAVRDAQILDHAVDPVGRIVDGASGDPKHGGYATLV